MVKSKFVTLIDLHYDDYIEVQRGRESRQYKLTDSRERRIMSCPVIYKEFTYHFTVDSVWWERKNKIKNLINAFLAIYPDMEYGPAHVVLSDHNLWDSNIQFCMGEITKAIKAGKYTDGLAATSLFLATLMFIPEEVRVMFE